MIIDKLNNASKYYGLNQRVVQGLKYLQNQSKLGFEVGKHQLDGDKLIALVMEYETKELTGALLEAHRKYIDIQYIIQGSERIGVRFIDGLETAIEYDRVKDIAFYHGSSDLITINEGTFAIFTPDDAHMPNIMLAEPALVKKVVVKVLVD